MKLQQVLCLQYPSLEDNSSWCTSKADMAQSFGNTADNHICLFMRLCSAEVGTPALLVLRPG